MKRFGVDAVNRLASGYLCRLEVDRDWNIRNLHFKIVEAVTTDIANRLNISRTALLKGKPSTEEISFALCLRYMRDNGYTATMPVIIFVDQLEVGGLKLLLPILDVFQHAFNMGMEVFVFFAGSDPVLSDNVLIKPSMMLKRLIIPKLTTEQILKVIEQSLDQRYALGIARELAGKLAESIHEHTMGVTFLVMFILAYINQRQHRIASEEDIATRITSITAYLGNSGAPMILPEGAAADAFIQLAMFAAFGLQCKFSDALHVSLSDGTYKEFSVQTAGAFLPVAFQSKEENTWRPMVSPFIVKYIALHHRDIRINLLPPLLGTQLPFDAPLLLETISRVRTIHAMRLHPHITWTEVHSIFADTYLAQEQPQIKIPFQRQIPGFVRDRPGCMQNLPFHDVKRLWESTGFDEPKALHATHMDPFLQLMEDRIFLVPRQGSSSADLFWKQPNVVAEDGSMYDVLVEEQDKQKAGANQDYNLSGLSNELKLCPTPTATRRSVFVLSSTGLGPELRSIAGNRSFTLKGPCKLANTTAHGHIFLYEDSTLGRGFTSLIINGKVMPISKVTNGGFTVDKQQTSAPPLSFGSYLCNGKLLSLTTTCS